MSTGTAVIAPAGTGTGQGVLPAQQGGQQVLQPAQQVPGNPNNPGQQGGAGGGGAGGGGGGGAGGGGGGGAAGGAAAALPANFALTPALVTNNYLDYSQTADAKLYYKAIAPIATPFDLSSANMKDFLEAVLDKAVLVNWVMTLLIMWNGMQYNLIQHYGVLTLEAIRQHVLTYAGTPTRHAQNATMMFACLRDSLTEAARKRVALEAHKYRINGMADGLLYFKVIVGIAHLDTRATVTVIRTRLSSLDTKISDLQDNIIELNEFVKAQQAGLEARGERTDDLLVNLFKAYKACKDKEFTTWVKTKEDAYNEGNDFTPEELMTLADNKYQSLIDAGNWLQQTEDQKRIVAMAAQIDTLEKAKANAKKPDGKKGAKNTKKGKKNDKNKKGGRFAWLYEEPGPNQPKEKDIKGTMWYWCVHHGQKGKWVKHPPDKCELRKEKEKKDKENKPKPSTDSGAMKVTGMVAVYPDDDDF